MKGSFHGGYGKAEEGGVGGNNGSSDSDDDNDDDDNGSGGDGDDHYHIVVVDVVKKFSIVEVLFSLLCIMALLEVSYKYRLL